MRKRIVALGILALPILYISLVLDVGWTSSFFIKRDFNNAFSARKAGNCDLFRNYIINDIDEWHNRCLGEKSPSNSPISKFKIEALNIADGEAFLQVRLYRDVSPRDVTRFTEAQLEEINDGYLASYDMVRSNSHRFLGILPRTRWLIRNSIN